MYNLKEKILNAFSDNKNLNNIFNDLSRSQKYLLNSYNSPKFADSKTDIMSKYNDLQNLGESLYKYDILSKNNFEVDANDIKNKIKKYILTTDFANVFGYISDQIDANSNKVAKSSVVEDFPSWIMPCQGRITSEYGWRIHPITNERKFHRGWDIAVPIGTAVKAIADGKVVYAGYNDPKGYGIYVKIYHGIINGVSVTSEYGHISSFVVKSGQYIKQGQVIAYSGNTGASTGPHLHITIKENNSDVNPEKYIKY